MDGARLSPYPDFSWFGVWRTVSPHEPKPHVALRQVAHCVFYTQSGRADIRWICRGHEQHFNAIEKSVHFAPADGEEHIRLAKCSPGHRFYMMLIPQPHIDEIVSSEGIKPVGELRHVLASPDPLLNACVEQLGEVGCPRDSCSASAATEAARRFVLRLHELLGGGMPDWHDDVSVFQRRTLNTLVDYIDEHLRIAPSLGEMALLAGLSPSHFAKKFRQSTGLSLHRFINRRRVKRSLDLLRVNVDSLTSLAHGLGFSSQSHFTRLFSGLTGMTPAKFRKQFNKTVG